MIKPSKTSKALILATVAYSALFFVLGVLFCMLWLKDTSFIIPFFTGIFSGTVFSSVKLILLERTINKSLDMEAGASKSYVSAHFGLRYILTGAVLAVAILNSFACFVGVTLTLYSVQISAYTVGFMEGGNRHKYKNLKRKE